MREKLCAVALLTILPIAMGSWAEDAPKKSTEPLPGSEIKVELAIKETDSIVVATVTGKSEIVDRSGAEVSYSRYRDKDDDGGGGPDFGDMITFARVKQQFQVKDVLSGRIKEGEAKLEYSYIEKSQIEHRGKPLEVSEDKLILFVKDKTLLKAMPATDENLAQVKKLLTETKKP